MKKIASLLIALGLAVAFTAPSFAGSPGAQPLTKADCKKAALKWNDLSNVSGKGKMVVVRLSAHGLPKKEASSHPAGLLFYAARLDLLSSR